MVTFEIGHVDASQALQSPRFHEWVFPDGTLWTEFFRLPDGYLIRFPAIADYTVDGRGRHVIASPRPDVSVEAVEHIYLNQVLPLAWSRQGRLVFHASAVDLDGRAVAFVGRSGFGKSTLAASFASAGRRLLCDDGLLLAESGGTYRVVPGHSSLRLWPDSEVALFRHSLERSAPLEYTSKSRFPASEHLRFCNEQRDLAALFFLGTGSADSVSLAPMRPADALVELVKQSFLIDTEEPEMLANHFDALSRLAALPIHYRLDYPRRYDVLLSVREAIGQSLDLLCETK